MSYLSNYVQKIKNFNLELSKSIEKTANSIGDDILEPFSFLEHEVGLLFGNVQSGKTGHMFGIISKAADLGFPVFLLLTPNNVVLHKQTLTRVQQDLNDFCICGENDSLLFRENMLIKPTIIVLKKNMRILRLWANIFNNIGFMRGNPLFIVDDEADESSLNTFINSEGQSSINWYLKEIKNCSSSSIYLQITATPQALLLQNARSGWRPNFIYYFSPGEDYLGGNFFFNNKTDSNPIIFINNISNPERIVFIRHLLVSAQLFLTDNKVSNCLIHPSVLQAEHQRYAELFYNEINWCKNNIVELKIMMEEEYLNLNSEKNEIYSFDKIYEMVLKILFDNKINILIINGKNHVDISKLFKGCNIIIGGNSLSRGITFPSLHTLYYSRISKKPQADTMWQHSRMFGYDRDAGLMRVFIDNYLYKLFLDINSTNNSIISQLKKGYENIKVYYPDVLSPTRRNVVNVSSLNVISGGTNYFAANPDNISLDLISELLGPFDDTEKYYQVNLILLKKILENIISSDDFNLSGFISIINLLIAENPIQQGILIVRRNRNVSQGTGSLLSSNDWDLVSRFKDKVILTMYQINGGNGWKKDDLWVPNIKFPDDIVYYDIKE